jgi:hypothetical protein
LLKRVAGTVLKTGMMARMTASLKGHFRPTKVKTALIERFPAPLAEDRIKTDGQRAA